MGLLRWPGTLGSQRERLLLISGDDLVSFSSGGMRPSWETGCQHPLMPTLMASFKLYTNFFSSFCFGTFSSTVSETLLKVCHLNKHTTPQQSPKSSGGTSGRRALVT